jgi:pimeloyl-ACP methyl ester carboxylesterase
MLGTVRRRSLLSWLVVATAATLLSSSLLAYAAPARSAAKPKPTIVLVHGAFADASSWSGVVTRLQRDGYTVRAPANPLQGVAYDASYLKAILATIKGPIVLVGHSYGGMVITNAATGIANVKALVYVAAYAPNGGDSVPSLETLAPGGQIGPKTLDITQVPSPTGSEEPVATIVVLSGHDVPRGDRFPGWRSGWLDQKRQRGGALRYGHLVGYRFGQVAGEDARE